MTWHCVSRWRQFGKTGKTWRCGTGRHVADSFGPDTPSACECYPVAPKHASTCLVYGCDGTCYAPVRVPVTDDERDPLDFSVEAMGR